MHDRSVLVTGCSSGIGRCVALALKERGYRVFATARKPADLVQLDQAGLEAIELHVDDPVSVAKAADQVLSASGGYIYGLFNNGAYGQPGAVEDLSWQVLEEQLRTNLLGWHELTRRIIPGMRGRREGRIIHNSSVLGLVAMPYRGAYNCSKFALEGLADTLRLELHGSGIWVSLIEPGPISSRFRENAHAKFKQNIDAENSVHRDSYRAMEARLAKEGSTTGFHPATGGGAEKGFACSRKPAATAALCGDHTDLCVRRTAPGAEYPTAGLVVAQGIRGWQSLGLVFLLQWL